MSMAAGLDGTMLGNTRFLAETRKGVVLAEERDDRAAFARFADDGRRNARDTLSDAKALVAQFRGMLGRRAHFGIADFRHPPDAVAQGNEAALRSIHMLPDLVSDVHVLLQNRS